MAITDAQQAKQIMMKKGGPVIQAGVKNYKPSKMVTVPKVAKSSPTHPTAKLAYITDAEKKLLIKKNLHGSLKGKPNRGPGGIPSLEGDFGGPGGFGGFEGGGGSRSDNDVSGRRDTGTGDYRDSTRPDDVAARKEYEVNRAAREKAAKEKAEKERVQKEIDKYNKAQAKKVRQMKRNKTLQDILEDEELEKQNQTLGFGDRLDKGLNKIGLGKKGFIERTKASNLKDLGMLDKKFGTIGGVPVGFTTGILEAFNVPKETAMFDIDSIREIGSVLGKQKTGMTKSQSKTLGDLRQDIQVEDKYNRGTLTNQEFQDYMNRNKLPERDDRGPEPIIPIIAQTPESQKKEEEEDPFQLALAFRADGGRVPYADGGIMDLESARQMLFLGGIAKSIGKAVKGATRAVKKIVKSPVGKIGLAAFLGPKIFAGMGGTGGFGGLGSLFSKGKGLFDLAKANPLVTSLAGGALAGLLQSKGLKDENQDGLDDETGLDIEAILADPYGKGGLRGRYDYGSGLKDGGMPAEKGLMNLQGMEMDFREEGGFVPIGKKERADDVPARLSKNEFVMTADAVRGAGDGDIDKGAEKMYNLMDKLEAENDQSQGLDGARKMFKTAQRLEEVL